ncbi:MAG: hypothetical protein QM756_40810 [Polyangiaceae bacterium]
MRNEFVWAVLCVFASAGCGAATSASDSSGGSSATGGSTAGGSTSTSGGNGSAGSTGSNTDKFSFFVASVGSIKMLSGNPLGFGGDLRFGEAGDGAGLRGADKICTAVAELSLAGSGSKGWHAFLSAKSAGPGGSVVHAKDRIGEGPWYDRMGRLVAQNLTDLISRRPVGADAAIINDLPNEFGIPNHSDGAPGCTGNDCPDNHDTLTGTNDKGTLYTLGTNPTCDDWTSAVGTAGQPHCGHSWFRGSSMGGGMATGPDGSDMTNWMSALDEAGCAPGINLVEMGPPNPQNPTVGSGGGYGGIYCFAMQP